MGTEGILCLVIGVVAIAWLVIWWLFREPKKPVYVHVMEDRNYYGSTDFPPERPIRIRERPVYYNPGVTMIETESGFVDGMVVGEIMAQRPAPIVEETGATSTFAGFSGGDSGGGGATSDYSAQDTPASDSCSVDASSSDGGCSSDS
jgi:hypothetical protein